MSSLKSKEGLEPIIASLEYQAAEGSLLMPSEEQKKIPEFSVVPAGGWGGSSRGIIARMLFVNLRDEAFPQDAAEGGPDTGSRFSKKHESHG